MSVGIRDIILPGEMKDLMNKVTEAKKAAEANLIVRREETAAMRSQANTAKLLADNPTLMRLRELEVLEKVATSGKLSVVLGEMRCNRWEREMWYRWQPRIRWSNLCPILFADCFGLLVVMPRASQPVSQEQIDALPDYYPAITAEFKPEDYGIIGKRVVVLDYGLPCFDQVQNRRRNYQCSGPAEDFNNVT